jgi:hypothetical protein
MIYQPKQLEDKIRADLSKGGPSWTAPTVRHRPFEGGFSFANFLVDVLAVFVFVVLAGLKSERNAP